MTGDAQRIEFRLCVDDGYGRLVHQEKPVTGFQIGRYAVIACGLDVTVQGRHGGVYVGGCLVVHWQSGAVVARAADFLDGCWLADYISAFGPEVDGEDAGSTHAAIVQGMPPELIAYLTAPGHRQARERPSFPAWRAAQQAGNLAAAAPDAGSVPAEG